MRCQIRFTQPIQRRIVGVQISSEMKYIVLGHQALDLKAMFDKDLKAFGKLLCTHRGNCGEDGDNDDL